MTSRNIKNNPTQQPNLTTVGENIMNDILSGTMSSPPGLQHPFSQQQQQQLLNEFSGGALQINGAIPNINSGRASGLGHCGLPPGLSDMRNQNDGPIMRSMSDATDFMRRPTFNTYDLDFGLNRAVLNCSLLSNTSNSSCGANQNIGGGNTNTSLPTNRTYEVLVQNLMQQPQHQQVERPQVQQQQQTREEDELDDDNDLNTVFDEIDALQNKCLDEGSDGELSSTGSTDTATALGGMLSDSPVIEPLSTSLPTQSMLNTIHMRAKEQQQAQQLQCTNKTNTNSNKVYPPEIYDQADINLVEELNPQNVQ